MGTIYSPGHEPHSVPERDRAIRDALDGPYGDNAVLFSATKALWEAAKFPDPIKYGERIILRNVIQRCDDLKQPYPGYDIFVYMVGAAAQLFADERLNELPPDISVHYPRNDTGLVGQWRDYIIRLHRKLLDPKRTVEVFERAVSDSFIALIERLPAIARERPNGDPDPDSVTSLPLFDVLTDIPDLLDAVLEPFTRPEIKDIGLFKLLNDTIQANLDGVSKYDGESRRFIHAILKNTPLEDVLVSPRVIFQIPVSKRLEHTAVIAGSGWGKTQLLQTMIVDDLQSPYPPSIIVIDSTNNIVEGVQQLALFTDKLRDRLLVIDPERSPSPALNMFDIATSRMSAYSEDMRERLQSEVIALFSYIFSSNQNALTDPMRTALSFVVRLLLTIPGANITTLRKLLEENPKRGFEESAFKPYMEQLDPTAQDFFRVQYFSDRVGGTRASILQRLSSVISIPAFERMFSRVNKVDFFDEMQQGACILVNTSEAMLKDASALFGRYIIARVMAAAFERASIRAEDRRPAFLIVDEAAPYFDEQFEKLLTRVRQFKLGVVIAFQHLEQASEKLRSAIASNTTVKYAGGLGYTDSRWLAREMRTTPEQLLALQKDPTDPPQYTSYACHVRGMQTCVNLRLPFFALEKMPKMAPNELAVMRERNQARVGAMSATREAVPSSPKTSNSPPAASASYPSTEQPSGMPSNLSRSSQKTQSAQNDPGDPADKW